MSLEVGGIIGIVIAQICMFAKMIVDGRIKARESHLLSVEKGFTNITARQDTDIALLRAALEKCNARIEELREHVRECELDKVRLETRLLLLEKFRNIAASDDPTGATKDAMPPPLDH